MEISLDIKERMELSRLMPQNGDYLQMLQVRNLLKLFDPTEEEIKSGIEQTPNGYTYKPESPKKMFDLSVEQLAMIKGIIKTADESRQITRVNIDVVERFMNL